MAAVARLFCDSNVDMLEHSQRHIADWEAANTVVQRTIKAARQVIKEHADRPEKIGLDTSIQAIENNLERMEEIHEAATEILQTYEQEAVCGVPVKKARSYAFSGLELFIFTAGLVSQGVDNFKDSTQADSTLKWFSLTCYTCAAALSRFKERYLQNWGKDEQTIGDLKALVINRDDVIPSVRVTCEILKVFSRTVNPDEFVKEQEWATVLRRINQMPAPHREVLNPHKMQEVCLRTTNFQEVEKQIIEDMSSGSPDRTDSPHEMLPAAAEASPTLGLARGSPRSRLLNMIDRIRTQNRLETASDRKGDRGVLKAKLVI